MTGAELTAWQTAAAEECMELEVWQAETNRESGDISSSEGSSGYLMTFATSQKGGMGFRT